MKKILKLLMILLLLPIQIYAEESGRVFFYKNDGDETFDSKIYEYDTTEKLSIPFTKQGYVLTGWAYNSEADIPDYETITSVSNEWIDANKEDVKLYAIWKPIGNTGNIITIGDSYVMSTNWEDKLSTSLESPIIKAQNDIAGFSNTEKTFASLFEEACMYVHEEDPVNYIIVVGGYNDSFQTEEEIKNGIKDFEVLVHSKYPMAKIIIGMAGWQQNDETTQTKLLEVNKYYKEVCEEIGASYIDLQTITKELDVFSEDGFLPGDEAGDAYAEIIEKSMNSETEDFETEDFETEEVELNEFALNIPQQEGDNQKIEDQPIPEKQEENQNDEKVNEEFDINDIAEPTDEKISSSETITEQKTITPSQDLRGKFIWTLTLIDYEGNYLGIRIVEDGGTATDMPPGFKQAEFTNVHSSKTLYQEKIENSRRYTPPNTGDDMTLAWVSIFELSILGIMINAYILYKYSKGVIITK